MELFKHSQPSDFQRELRNNVIGIDKYATFKWRTTQYNSYELFGAFILNGGEDLTWVNAPEFSDEYSEPLFKTNRTLLGVTSSSRKISFDIGVYAITLKQYGEFINWLSPYVIDKLIFDYDDKWAYTAKISEISTSKKYVIGYDDTVPLYYAELNITFETQNEGYATCIDAWQKTEDPFNPSDVDTQCTTIAFKHQDSPLSHPCKIRINKTSTGDTTPSNASDYSLTCEAALLTGTDGDDHQFETITLFSIQFNPSAWTDTRVNLEYDSERGIILCPTGQLLTLNNVDSTGQTTVLGYNSYQFIIPGSLEDSNNPFLEEGKKISETTYSPVTFRFFCEGFSLNESDIEIETYSRKTVS